MGQKRAMYNMIIAIHIHLFINADCSSSKTGNGAYFHYCIFTGCSKSSRRIITSLINNRQKLVCHVATDGFCYQLTTLTTALSTSPLPIPWLTNTNGQGPTQHRLHFHNGTRYLEDTHRWEPQTVEWGTPVGIGWGPFLLLSRLYQHLGAGNADFGTGWTLIKSNTGTTAKLPAQRPAVDANADAADAALLQCGRLWVHNKKGWQQGCCSQTHCEPPLLLPHKPLLLVPQATVCLAVPDP